MNDIIHYESQKLKHSVDSELRYSIVHDVSLTALYSKEVFLLNFICYFFTAKY